MKMLSPLRILLQAGNYFLFMALVWYLSIYPPYRQLEDQQAVITLAFGHTAKRVEDCVTFSQSEVDQMAPNMRMTANCPRERSPLTLELRVDDQLITHLNLVAPGLYNDQGVDVYQDVKVDAGLHDVTIWMNDNVNIEGPTYTYSEQINIEAASRLYISFDGNTGSFSVK